MEKKKGTMVNVGSGDLDGGKFVMVVGEGMTIVGEGMTIVVAMMAAMIDEEEHDDGNADDVLERTLRLQARKNAL